MADGYVQITIRRTSGIVETVRPNHLTQGATLSAITRGKIVKANRDAATIDPSKGGEVLSIEWVPSTPDAEETAWDRWQDAADAVLTAEAAIDRDDGTGLSRNRLHAAQVALESARANYLATYGQTGAHYAAHVARLAAEDARRAEEFRTSFIGRGID